MELHLSYDDSDKTAIIYGVSYTNTTENGDIELHWPPDVETDTVTIENANIEQCIDLINKDTTPLVVDMVDDVERKDAKVIIAQTMTHPNLTAALETAINESNIQEKAMIIK